MIEIPFTKFDAAGNTWTVVASDHLQFPPSPRAPAATARFRRLARALCRPRRGPASDGLLVILPPEHARNLACVRFFNADGSEAEMSGNGIRCAAAWLGSKTGRVRGMRLETAAGLRVVSAGFAGSGSPHRERGYIVRMGQPILAPGKVPFHCGHQRGRIVGFPLPTRRGEIPVTVTSMGNPHCTLFVDGFERMNWKKLGREIELNPVFPNRTNVEFVRVISRREIEVRFWERGVGRTLSSGTGSCAAVVAGVLAGRTGRRVRVRTLAGSLEVAWPCGGEVRLAGPVRWVGSGVARFGG
ncbi:MAG TPA: diaminopimelate epimerase [Terriglobia bacterium]|nr:diaminopimelate epimerase [Terriglobia bacterium]